MNFQKPVSTIFAASCLVLLAFGCSTHKRDAFNERIMAPEPPVFLTSPAAALLTSQTGLVADVQTEQPTEFYTNRVVGKLFVKGTHLLFSPNGSDRTFVWDSSTHSGFAISDALQGYAPMSTMLYATEIRPKSETTGKSPERFNGLAGHEAEVTIVSSDTIETVIKVWKTQDFNGFPARLTFPGRYGTQIVNLSNLKPTVVSDKLFMPPDGFTAYASTPAMTSELMMRHSKTRDARPISADEDVPIGSGKAIHAPSRNL